MPYDFFGLHPTTLQHEDVNNFAGSAHSKSLVANVSDGIEVVAWTVGSENIFYAPAISKRWRLMLSGLPSGWLSISCPSIHCPCINTHVTRCNISLCNGGICHKYLSCAWELLNRFSRSEVKGQGLMCTDV